MRTSPGNGWRVVFGWCALLAFAGFILLSLSAFHAMRGRHPIYNSGRCQTLFTIGAVMAMAQVWLPAKEIFGNGFVDCNTRVVLELAFLVPGLVPFIASYYRYFNRYSAQILMRHIADEEESFRNTSSLAKRKSGGGVVVVRNANDDSDSDSDDGDWGRSSTGVEGVPGEERRSLPRRESSLKMHAHRLRRLQRQRSLKRLLSALALIFVVNATTVAFLVELHDAVAVRHEGEWCSWSAPTRGVFFVQLTAVMTAMVALIYKSKRFDSDDAFGIQVEFMAAAALSFSVFVVISTLLFALGSKWLSENFNPGTDALTLLVPIFTTGCIILRPALLAFASERKGAVAEDGDGDEDSPYDLLTILADDFGCKAFVVHLQREFSYENYMFVVQCQGLREIHRKGGEYPVDAVQDVFDNFLESDSPCEVNVSFAQRQAVSSALADAVARGIGLPASILAEAETEIFRIMERDSLPRFLRSSVWTQHQASLLERRRRSSVQHMFVRARRATSELSRRLRTLSGASAASAPSERARRCSTDPDGGHKRAASDTRVVERRHTHDVVGGGVVRTRGRALSAHNNVSTRLREFFSTSAQSSSRAAAEVDGALGIVGIEMCYPESSEEQQQWTENPAKKDVRRHRSVVDGIIFTEVDV